MMYARFPRSPDIRVGDPKEARPKLCAHSSWQWQLNNRLTPLSLQRLARSSLTALRARILKSDFADRWHGNVNVLKTDIESEAEALLDLKGQLLTPHNQLSLA